MNSIETRVLQFIGEDTSSPDVFTTSNLTPIRDSINDAIEELCTLSESVVNTYKIPLIANTNLYKIDFSTNQFCYILSAFLPDKEKKLTATTLSGVERLDRRWMSTTNTPMMYFNIGVDQIGFYPMYGVDGHYVELRCVTLPKRYSRSTEVLQFREDFEDALVNYSVGEYFLSVQDLEKSARWFGEYNKYSGSFGFRTNMPDRWIIKGEI